MSLTEKKTRTKEKAETENTCRREICRRWGLCMQNQLVVGSVYIRTLQKDSGILSLRNRNG